MYHLEIRALDSGVDAREGLKEDDGVTKSSWRTVKKGVVGRVGRMSDQA